MPCRFMRANSSNISSTSTGMMPSDGSSSMISFGSRHHGAGDRQHLLLAARQRVGRLAEALLQAREGLGDAVDHLGLARAVRRGDQAEAQVLLHGQAGHDAALLGHVGEAEWKRRCVGSARMFAAVEAHRAARGAAPAP